MPRAPFLLALIIALAALLLWAGVIRDRDGGDRAGNSDGTSASVAAGEVGVRAVIERDFLRPSPENCDEIYSERMVRRMADQRPIARSRGICRLAEEAEVAADDVDFLSVATANGSLIAIARARVRGGSAGGTTVTYRLIPDRDGWLIDELTDLRVHRPEFEEATRLSLSVGHVQDENARCVADALFERGSRVLERELIRDAGWDMGERARRQCLTRAELIDALIASTREDLGDEGLPPTFIRCAIANLRKLVSRFSERQLSTTDPPPGFARKFKKVAEACAALTAGDDQPSAS